MIQCNILTVGVRMGVLNVVLSGGKGLWLGRKFGEKAVDMPTLCSASTHDTAKLGMPEIMH